MIKKYAFGLLVVLSIFVSPTAQAQESLKQVESYVSFMQAPTTAKDYSKFWRPIIQEKLHIGADRLEAEYEESKRLHNIAQEHGVFSQTPKHIETTATLHSYEYNIKPALLMKDVYPKSTTEAPVTTLQITVEYENNNWHIAGETYIADGN